MAECGSCPIHPGNDSKTEEVTINYMIFGCDKGNATTTSGGKWMSTICSMNDNDMLSDGKVTGCFQTQIGRHVT